MPQDFERPRESVNTHIVCLDLGRVRRGWRKETSFMVSTAYLSLPLSIADMTSEVKMIFDDDDDIPTDITNLARTNSGQTEWYTPDGRQVTAPRHGLYIVNGKKVVVK